MSLFIKKKIALSVFVRPKSLLKRLNGTKFCTKTSYKVAQFNYLAKPNSFSLFGRTKPKFTANIKILGYIGTMGHHQCKGEFHQVLHSQNSAE